MAIFLEVNSLISRIYRYPYTKIIIMSLSATLINAQKDTKILIYWYLFRHSGKTKINCMNSPLPSTEASTRSYPKRDICSAQLDFVMKIFMECRPSNPLRMQNCIIPPIPSPLIHWSSSPPAFLCLPPSFLRVSINSLPSIQ